MACSNRYAVFSGTCASAASLFGKLSGLPILEGWLIIFRLIFFVLMILCNGGVWTLYVKALQASKSSLSPTVISAATNYLLSAITGYLVFGEITSLVWWIGGSLILTGLALIITDQTEESTFQDEKKIN